MMIRQAAALLVSLGLALTPAARPVPPPAPASAPDRVIVIVKQNSKIEFHASSTFAKVTGVFQDWNADFKLNTDTLENASLQLDIQAGSVHTGSGFKDKEVKGKNFFNVTQFPEIKFVSDGVLPDPDPQKFTMTGKLTLRGITRPVTVAVVTATQPSGTHLLNGTFEFNRRDFGMTHNMPFNKVADIIRVDIELEIPNDALPASKAASTPAPTM
jgi:polyisoprenoid-binding protein YceI